MRKVIAIRRRSTETVLNLIRMTNSIDTSKISIELQWRKRYIFTTRLIKQKVRRRTANQFFSSSLTSNLFIITDQILVSKISPVARMLNEQN